MSSATPQTDKDDDTEPEVARHRRWYGRRRLLVSALAVLAGLGLTQLYLGMQPGSGSGSPTPALSSKGQLVTEFPPDERGAAVDVEGTTLNGDELSLRDRRGNVVVVNVWGSWCPPCREEAPVLAATSEAYEDDEVTFVGINVRDNRAAAQAFEERYGITYPSIDDSSGQTLLALNEYVPANAVPATLVLDKQGRVAARALGAVTETTLTTLIDTVLAESGAAPRKSP